jgi:hypothetical protein
LTHFTPFSILAEREFCACAEAVVVDADEKDEVTGSCDTSDGISIPGCVTSEAVKQQCCSDEEQAELFCNRIKKSRHLSILHHHVPLYE